MTTLERVTKEIIDLHDFFTAWYNGAVERDQLEPMFLSCLHEEFVFISPDGHLITGPMLSDGFSNGYGTNPDFRIQIRDVAVRHEFGETVLATYTEWQVGATQSEHSKTARVSTVILDMGSHTAWRHLHETWLPEHLRAADSFDF